MLLLRRVRDSCARVYISKRSIPERSGAVTLTVSLTAVLLGGMVALSRIAAPVPAGDKAMHLFDVAAAEAIEAPSPEPESSAAPQPVEKQSPPAPSTAAPSTPVVVREPVPAPPAWPMVPASEAMPAGQPAGASGAAAHAAPAAAPAGGEAHAAPAAGKTAERRDEADVYGRAVFREIRARQSYPAELARAGVAGTVLVEFRVSSRGRVYAVVVISSEVRQLDRLAMAQVQSTPLPPPPRGEPRTFRIPMTYRMR
jgi:TonB family protein